MKYFLLLGIFCSVNCVAQRRAMPGSATTFRNAGQMEVSDITQYRLIPEFTDMVIENITNGDIPFIIHYNISKILQSDVTSGHKTTISQNQDCILEIPGANFRLFKNCHYQFYIDANRKIAIRQVYL